MKEALTKLLINIADLFKVKTILSLMLVITTCVLTVNEVIPAEMFSSLVGSVITYYFMRSKKEDSDDRSNSNNSDSRID